MKLELKHLAPYLPYRLQGIVNEEEIHTLLKLSLKYDQNPMWIDTFNNIESTKGESEIRSVFPEGFKPILRPLTDLTESKCKELLNDKNKFNFWYCENRTLGKYIFKEGYSSSTYKISEYTRMPYYMMEFFFRNHFDIFGLIKEGLAIDINTLQS
jgi:hypothetical protein